MDFDVAEGFNEPDRYAGTLIAEIVNSFPDLARKALARELDKPDVEAWQPIETAPRDGRNVLVCVTYNLPDDEWETKMWVDSFFEGAWFRWSDMIDVPFTPTHWRPLPDPPRAALGDQDHG